jgi:two-component system, NtrC family, sensor kinase
MSESKYRVIAEKLEERVKELTCLYELSKISSGNLSLKDKLEAFLSIIPQGWQFPKAVRSSICIDGAVVGHRTNENNEQFAPIIIDDKERGHVCVQYDNIVDATFLAEEQHLLEQIAQHISNTVYRHEKKAMEEAMQKKMRDDDKLYILSELTAGVAHELNTPLGNILGYAELLKNAMRERQQIEDLQVIITSALNAREIVKKLMYFSCEMPTNFNYIQLNEVIRSSSGLMKIQLQDKNIDLMLDLDDQLPPLQGDELQLTQVMLNLLMNAVAASEHSGQIFVATRKKQTTIEIIVQDFGIGIPSSKINKIFEPFFTTKKTGTGLGLAVVHGIIQAHKASIQVKSEENKTTIFTITFPLDEFHGK